MNSPSGTEEATALRGRYVKRLSPWYYVEGFGCWVCEARSEETHDAMLVRYTAGVFKFYMID